MKVLVIGSGGREHALAWGLSRAPSVEQLWCTPGNGGIGWDVQLAPVPPDDADAIAAFCTEHFVDLVVIGPEAPLVAGLADALTERGVAVFGCSAAAARLEGSKEYMKQVCVRYGIPTATYEAFDNAKAAIDYIRSQGAPIVVKADGLAAGKGVTVAQTENEAIAAVEACFAGKFGEAGARVVIEEFLVGEEVSFFALCDGERAIEFGFAQDHKTVGEGDTGPNTGGMGTYAPAPVMTDALRRQIMEEIIQPTLAGMKSEGAAFRGVLFAGLMIAGNKAKLLEYNVRFGDPEIQSLIMRLDSDLGVLLKAAAVGSLQGMRVSMKPQAALCVVMAAKGYPGPYAKGSQIRGIERAESPDYIKVFHAGTEIADGKLLSAGGRVLGVTALGKDIAQAQARAYEAVDKIDWPDGFCRRDIGWRAVSGG